MINRGSEWGKWDLHVHTPYSTLNNEFGNPETQFEIYVRKMLKKAIEKKIKVVGLTDYYLIEGYQRFKEEYLKNTNKLKKISNIYASTISEEMKKDLEFSDEEIGQIKEILFLPNIEFREKTVIGGHKVNFHVIFSDKVKPDEIKTYFLNKIEYEHKRKTYHLEEKSLKDLGVIMKCDNPKLKKGDLAVGMEQVRISISEVIEKLKNEKRFLNKYLILIDPDEDLSKIDWISQDSSARKDFIYCSDAFFTSEKNTVKFGLAQLPNQSIKKFKETFGGLKPTFHGSDAHNFEKMFEPDLKRYTWIKARPTFEGLKQVIIEPEKRIRIQENSPNEKIARETIKSIKFINKTEKKFISEKEINFNKDLNSIIGGKGAGKSFLIYSLIKVIGINKLEDISKEQSEHKNIFEGYDRLIEENIKNIKVTFDDGKIYDLNEKGEVAFTYLPQNYLFKLSQDINKDKNFIKMLKDILNNENNLNIYELEDELEQKLKVIKSDLQFDVREFINFAKELEKVIIDLKEYGEKNQLEKSIYFYKKELKEIEVDQKTIDEYNKLQENIKKCKDEKILLKTKAEEIKKIVEDIVGLEIKTLLSEKLRFPYSDKNMIDHYISEYINYLKVNDANSFLITKKDTEILKIEKKLEQLESNIFEDMEKIKVLNSNVTNKIRFDEIQKIIKSEEEKLKEYKEKELQKNSLERNILILKEKIATDICFYKMEYNNFINKVKLNSQNGEIELEVDLDLKIDNFIDNVGGKIVQRKLEIKEYFSEEGLVDINKFEENLKKIIQKIEDLEYRSKNDMTTFLNSIIENFYSIRYSLKYNGDNISKLSHGKRGIALLKLYLEKDNSTSPLLIDQPEDNLDNRTIFEHLVEFIKEKKEMRQIMIVSHNANLVVSTDSENIIVSNEHGESTENENKFRLGYINGALEESYIAEETIHILSKIGIREHVCEILEGGKEAFKKRNQKYRIID